MIKFIIQIKNIAEYLKATRILTKKLLLQLEFWDTIDLLFIPMDQTISFNSAAYNALLVKENNEIVPVNSNEYSDPALQKITVDQLYELDKILSLSVLLGANDQDLLSTPLQEVNEFFLPKKNPNRSKATRAYNCLRAGKINTLGELIAYSREKLLLWRMLGDKCLDYVEEAILKPRSLQFAK